MALKRPHSKLLQMSSFCHLHFVKRNHRSVILSEMLWISSDSFRFFFSSIRRIEKKCSLRNSIDLLSIRLTTVAMTLIVWLRVYIWSVQNNSIESSHYSRNLEHQSIANQSTIWLIMNEYFIELLAKMYGVYEAWKKKQKTDENLITSVLIGSMCSLNNCSLGISFVGEFCRSSSQFDASSLSEECICAIMLRRWKTTENWKISSTNCHSTNVLSIILCKYMSGSGKCKCNRTHTYTHFAQLGKWLWYHGRNLIELNLSCLHFFSTVINNKSLFALHANYDSKKTSMGCPQRILECVLECYNINTDNSHRIRSGCKLIHSCPRRWTEESTWWNKHFEMLTCCMRWNRRTTWISCYRLLYPDHRQFSVFFFRS